MRILLKCPTRSRPQKIMSTLTQYMKLANHPEQIGVVLSCDDTDTTMSRNLVHEEIHRILKNTAFHKIFTSSNRSKIEACNANMSEIGWEWDIVVLVSDDMIPQIQGYDDVIRNHMIARFPDTDGILWCNDGTQAEKLNTLSILGRKMYERFGYIYNPEYKSLFCDTEFTDLCKGSLKEKCTYIPHCIIRHEHPGTGFAQNMDALYDRNQKYWNEDMYTYIRRKVYPHDITFLIPTIPGRETSLRRLTASIHERMSRIAPTIRYTIDIGFDNRQATIGMKREQLVQSVNSKYCVFIDDDDEITDAYIEDMYATIRGEFPVMRLRGQIQDHTFTHSLENKLSSPIAIGTVFLRPPNHLNPMFADVAKLIHYRDIERGEDLDWSIRMAKSGFLTHEYKSDDSRTHYLYKTEGRSIDVHAIAKRQRQMTFEMIVSNPSEQPIRTQPQGLRFTPHGFVSK